jgi:hypothetical protein
MSRAVTSSRIETTKRHITDITKLRLNSDSTWLRYPGEKTPTLNATIEITRMKNVERRSMERERKRSGVM